MNGSQSHDNRREKSAANSVLRGFDRHKFVLARKSADLTVQKLGQKAGVDRAAIHRWESGECLPMVDSLSLVARALGTSIEHFLTVPDAERTLADLRVVAGLTQVQLAQRTGLTRKVLGGLERGGSVMDEGRAAALADVFKIPAQAVRDAHVRSTLTE